MKAITCEAYGPPETLSFRADEPLPSFGSDEVRIRVRAASAHAGDWHLARGDPYLVRLAFGLRRPKQRIVGMDAAGEVEAVGERVHGLEPGDEVFGVCAGAFAEFARARPEKLAKKPKNVSFEQAAAVPTSGLTALQALRDEARTQPGQAVLIIGAAGGVGTFAVQIAKSLGARVTAVCSTQNVELVRALGADHVVDYTREDFATHAGAFDVVIDNVGARTLGDCRSVLRPDGTLVLVGVRGGKLLGGVERSLGALLLGPLVRQRLRPLFAREHAADLHTLAQLLEAGTIAPVISRTFALGDVPNALRYLETGHARGKVVITV